MVPSLLMRWMVSKMASTSAGEAALDFSDGSDDFSKRHFYIQVVKGSVDGLFYLYA